ncbi:MAG: hypothetical protein R2873_26035 [Caldilineaceae bacterium]
MAAADRLIDVGPGVSWAASSWRRGHLRIVRRGHRHRAQAARERRVGSGAGANRQADHGTRRTLDKPARQDPLSVLGVLVGVCGVRAAAWRHV